MLVSDAIELSGASGSYSGTQKFITLFFLVPLYAWAVLVLRFGSRTRNLTSV